MLTQLQTHFISDLDSVERFADCCNIKLLKKLEDTLSYYVADGLGTLGPSRNRDGFVLRGLFRTSRQEDASRFLDFSCKALESCSSTIRSATMARKRGGGSLPELPAGGMATHAVLTTQSEIEESYFTREVFFSAWDKRQSLEDGRFLCFRALDAISSGDFLAAVQDRHWAMARAVKPGLAKYYAAQWEEEEEPLLFGGPDTLNPVGTEKKDGVRAFEFTCYLEDGQHIRPMEIHAVRNTARKGQFHDHEFDEVRVVFNDRKTALQEAVPLLDVGSKVYFIGEDTELVELTADDVIRLRGG